LNIIQKLKQWMLDVWKSLKETFGTWTEDDMKIFDGDIDKAIEYFNNLTMRDFATGVKLNAPTITQEVSSQAQNTPSYYEGNVTPDTAQIGSSSAS